MKMMTFIFSLLLISNIAMAVDKDKKFEKGQFLKKELNLSDEQMEKVKEIRKSGKVEIKASKQKFRSVKTEFKEAMKNPEASNAELTSKFDAFQKARDEFQKKRFSMLLKMREVLNPEQLKKFQEMKKKHKGKRKLKKKS